MTGKKKNNGMKEGMKELIWFLKIAFIIGLFFGSYKTNFGEVNYILGLQSKSIVAVIYEFLKGDKSMAFRALVFAIPGLAMIVGLITDLVRHKYSSKETIVPIGFIIGTFICGAMHFYFVFMIESSFNSLFVPIGLIITSIFLVIMAIKQSANRTELIN